MSIVNIIELSETKCDLSDIQLDNYIVSHFNRAQNPKQKQVYGGLAILINKNAIKGVKFLKNTCSEYQWLILDKTVFGDFNARTGNLEDFISNNDDDYNDYVPVPEEYESNKIKQSRLSNDKSCSRGKELLNMCISSRIRILNGRTFGDYQGKFISYQYNGNSVIDYCLVSEDFIENVLYFHVDDQILRLSDQAKVSVRQLVSVQVNCLKENLDDFPLKFKWETISPELFLNALKSDEMKVKIQDFKSIQTQSQS
ncbi:unnamed protein product [Mytilus coruscus]|uniref:Endonuclease/exonuclease/phosphatase domain-containing protein n=1 Tax=Mytilus coruscus TaxID=42192 RepID=A0A6J8CJ13_MYTCO|nr:unnamed protein product [Mytilus coruscus]